MRIGTIKQIWRYPVKSMAGEQIESCAIGVAGIPGDRGWAIRDDKTGEITNGKQSRLNPAAAWDVRRFRPNFLIETDGNVKGLIESEWSGQTIRVGDVELKGEISTPRCGMTIQAQKDFPKDPSILRSIVKEANQNFGVYANAVNAGRVQIGDPVFV